MGGDGIVKIVWWTNIFGPYQVSEVQ